MIGIMSNVKQVEGGRERLRDGVTERQRELLIFD